MTPPERTPEGWSSAISLTVDEDGAFGRECPNPDCLNYFKLFQPEYDLARLRRRLTCPACGHTGDDEAFFTADQLRRIAFGTQQFLEAAGHSALSDFSRSMGDRTVRLGPNVSIRYTAHRNPAPISKPLPTYVEQGTLRTFVCPDGGHRAVIYDLLTACPYCGPDTPPRAIFDDNLAAMRRRLRGVEGLSPEAKAAGERTTAIEQSLTRVISALQNLAKQLHAQAGKEAPAGNPWQNIERLQKRWLADFEDDPLTGLDTEMIKTLRRAFGGRHVIEHNGGVVDVKYVAETGEGAIGRRLRLSTPFVEGALVAAVALADRLEATIASR